MGPLNLWKTKLSLGNMNAEKCQFGQETPRKPRQTRPRVSREQLTRAKKTRVGIQEGPQTFREAEVLEAWGEATTASLTNGEHNPRRKVSV